MNNRIDFFLHPPPDDVGLQEIIDFWNLLSCAKDAGETTWRAIEELQAEVTDCLFSEPPDIAMAMSLTAKAILLISGQCES